MFVDVFERSSIPNGLHFLYCKWNATQAWALDETASGPEFGPPRSVVGPSGDQVRPPRPVVGPPGSQVRKPRPVSWTFQVRTEKPGKPGKPGKPPPREVRRSQVPRSIDGSRGARGSWTVSRAVSQAVSRAVSRAVHGSRKVAQGSREVARGRRKAVPQDPEGGRGNQRQVEAGVRAVEHPSRVSGQVRVREAR